MITYGLDIEISHKVFRNNDDEPRYSNISSTDGGSINDLKTLEFTNYAKIGLQNFFNMNPEQFLSRLAKGPPP